MSKLRFAIVGCGTIHGTHIDAIQNLPDDTELVAVCDEIPERADATAAKHQVRAYHDLSVMLQESSFDVLCVCTPSGLHSKHGILGAKAGKHIICEKPIDVSLAAADALIAACHENSVKLEVISQHRFTPGMQQLRRWQQEGRLGTLCYGEAATKWYRTQEYYDSGGWRGTWELDGGGALMNQGVHFVDQLRWVMGPVKSVAATMSTRAHVRIEVEDTVSATIEFESGATGTLIASTALFPGYRQSLEIYGTHGTVMVDSNNVQHAQFSDGNEERTPGGVKTNPPEVKNGVWVNDSAEPKDAASGSAGHGASDPRAISTRGHLAHFHDLIQAIREDRETFMNGAEARAALELIIGVYRSAKTGERVYFPLT